MNGTLFKVWGVGDRHGSIDHDCECTDLVVALLKNGIDDVLIGPRIPKEWRKTYRPDMVLVIGDRTFFWEHDRDTEDADQLESRMTKLRECPFDVLWTCPSNRRSQEILDLAPNNRHWVAIFAAVLAGPFGQPWTNVEGTVAGLPRPSDVQLDVQ